MSIFYLIIVKQFLGDSKPIRIVDLIWRPKRSGWCGKFRDCKDALLDKTLANTPSSVKKTRLYSFVRKRIAMCRIVAKLNTKLPRMQSDALPKKGASTVSA